MELREALSPDAVAPALKPTSKKHLLQEIAQRAADVYGFDARTTAERLMERERLGSTGMGGGVAIPHARIEGIETIRAVFARMEKGVDFDAADDAPVDLAFALFAPADSGANHLRALARVSRLLRDAAVLSRLRATDDPSALYAVLTQDEASRAA